MIGGKDHIRTERQFEAAAAANPVDRADHRFVEARQLLQAAETADAVVTVHGVTIGRGF